MILKQKFNYSWNRKHRHNVVCGMLLTVDCHQCITLVASVISKRGLSSDVERFNIEVRVKTKVGV